MELEDAIQGRSSVRKMSDYYVTDEELLKIFESVKFSPSWANYQPWKFIVVRDKDAMQKVDPRVSASALIVVCGKVNISGHLQGEATTKFKEWFMFDLGIASYGFSLKAHELGLSTVIMGNLKHNEIKDVLDIPGEYEPAVIIPIGKPLEENENPKERKQVKDIVFLGKFGEPFIK